MKLFCVFVKQKKKGKRVREDPSKSGDESPSKRRKKDDTTNEEETPDASNESTESTKDARYI